MIRHKMQSCCGGESYIYTSDVPVLKQHVKLFEDRGFSVLQHYLKAGIFQAVLKGLILTVTLGQTKINVRVSGKDRQALINTFEDILKTLENEKS